ncbi:MAG: transglutaminase-like cysteine peptidase [Gammaproteobacteria bacterium]|nr:transglutaminase-like cysteine peptidase [Gammaproteobacteria bacterium]
MSYRANGLHDKNDMGVWLPRWTIAALFFLFVGLFSTQQQAKPFADNQMLERLQNNYNSEAENRGIALNNLIDRLGESPVLDKLVGVNRFFNTFSYQDDMALWGVKDYWATPEEFIGIYQGDCEDYVISKYFALRALGIEDERLYLTYVKATRENIAHMVLSYFERPQGIPLILDNYDLRIISADKRTDLLPVYSFNAKSLFLTNSSAGLGQALPTDKVKNSKWEKLLVDIGKVSS